MAEKDGGLGLNLSLSLRCPEDLPPLPPPLSLVPSFMHQPHQEKSSLRDAFRISSGLELIADCSAEMGLRMRGIDVNRPVTVAECWEEMVVSSPNSTVSSVSGKMCEREENETERASDSLEDDGGEAARKKLRLSKDQSAMLEETFKEHNTLTPKQKVALAKQLNLRPRQVEVWFQNRRARTKLKQTEVDCEYLRRCCENLTEENRRLKKEVNELRALKLTPQFYMNMNPPTTLTMCPSCERVAISSSSSSAAASSAMATTSAGTARNHNNVPLDQQRPIPTNACAAVFSSQPYDAHHPRP